MRTVPLFLAALTLPATALAQSPGEALAKQMETTKSAKTQQVLLARVQKLEPEQKQAFVDWARSYRKEQKTPWRHLAKALGKIGGVAAAQELGEVARFVTEEKGYSKVIRSALEALTSMDPTYSLGELLKGVRHTDRTVRTEHRIYLTRFAAEGTSLSRDGVLRAISREASRLQEQREDLEGEDLVEAAKKLKAIKELENLFIGIVADAIESSNYLSRHLSAVGNTSRPKSMQIGCARGIAKRTRTRLAPLLREIRRLRRQRQREAKKRDETYEALSEEDARRQVFRTRPQLETLWRATQRELPRLERTLTDLAESEDAEVRFEVAKAVPAVRKSLDQTWADVMFPLLSSKNPSWIADVAKALTELTGAKGPGQSRPSWELWWKQQQEDQ